MYKDNKHTVHYVPARKIKRKSLVIAIVAILCAIISAVTMAYVYTKTNEVKNTFTGTTAGVEIEEEFDGKVKSNVAVKNNGDIPSYIRATVVVTWMSDDEERVTARQPQVDVDYTVTYAENTDWQKGADGYWYYKIPVAPNSSTENLIDECKLKDGATVPEGFYLSVEIVASAIQATPTDVVAQQWSSGVSSVDGDKLVIIGG